LKKDFKEKSLAIHALSKQLTYYFELQNVGFHIASNVSDNAGVEAGMLPGANFINFQCSALMPTDPKSVKIQLSHLYHFTLLGSGRVKAVFRTLTKKTPVDLQQDQTLAPHHDIGPHISLNLHILKKLSSWKTY